MRKTRTVYRYGEQDVISERFEYCDRCYPLEKEKYQNRQFIGYAVSIVVFILFLIIISSMASNWRNNFASNEDNTVRYTTIGGTVYEDQGDGVFVATDNDVHVQVNQNTPERIPFPIVELTLFLSILGIVSWKKRGVADTT